MFSGTKKQKKLYAEFIFIRESAAAVQSRVLKWFASEKADFMVHTWKP